MKSHRLDGINNRNSFFHGSWRLEVQDPGASKFGFS